MSSRNGGLPVATCRHTRERLTALLDGELVREEVDGVGAHLDNCSQCRRERDALRGIQSWLSEDPLPGAGLPSGAEVTRSILEREAARARPPWRLPALVWPPAVALAVVIAVHARQRPEPGRVPQQAITAPSDAPATLVIIDDERTGRMVQVAPVDSSGTP